MAGTRTGPAKSFFELFVRSSTTYRNVLLNTHHTNSAHNQPANSRATSNPRTSNICRFHTPASTLETGSAIQYASIDLHTPPLQNFALCSFDRGSGVVFSSFAWFWRKAGLVHHQFCTFEREGKHIKGESGSLKSVWGLFFPLAKVMGINSKKKKKNPKNNCIESSSFSPLLEMAVCF